VARLAEAAGGRVVTTPAELLARPASGGRRRQPAWPLLAALALGAFMVEVSLRRIPVLREVAGKALASLLAWVRRMPASPQPEDREYDAADRWRVMEDEAEARRSADMAQAARLYIARLRQQQEGDRKRE
jgi:hypothetical protein